jgi:hypothetical protein
MSRAELEALRVLHAAAVSAYESAWYAAESGDLPDWESLGALVARVLEIVGGLIAAAEAS